MELILCVYNLYFPFLKFYGGKMYLILVAVFSLTLFLTSCNQLTTSPESEEPDSHSVSELPNIASGTIAYESIAEFFLAASNGGNASDAYFAPEGAELIAQSTRAVWNSNYNRSYSVGSGNLYPRLSFQQNFIKAFNNAKVKLLFGTDSPVIPGVVPGFSLLREL